MRLFQLRHHLPARQNLVLIVERFDQPDDSRGAGSVRCGKKGAPAFGTKQLLNRVDLRDCVSFVIVPKSHSRVQSWKIVAKKTPWMANETSRTGCGDAPHRCPPLAPIYYRPLGGGSQSSEAILPRGTDVLWRETRSQRRL